MMPTKKIFSSKTISPKKIYDEISRDVVGQDEAKVMVSNLIFMYFVQLCEIMTLNIEKKIMAALLMGPTGSGKTYMVNKAADALRRLTGFDICPVFEIDCTQLSSRGWEGEHLLSLFNGHIKRQKTELAINSTIVFLDEFDKLCKPAVGSGGTDFNKMTQYDLLKTMEGVFLDSNHNYKTHNMLFVLAGNFSEIRTQRDLDAKPDMGFVDSEKLIKDKDYHTELDDAGVATQIVGRIAHVSQLYELQPDDLMDILNRFVLPELRDTWNFIGHDININDTDKRLIVESAFERKTGARGLRADIAKYFEEQIFDLEFKF